MFTLSFFIFGFIFVLIAIVLWFATNISIEEKIREELHEYGYKLVTIKSTKRTIPIKEKPTQSWRKHIVMNYYPGNDVRYKEITFSDKENRSFQCIVVIKVSLFLSSKLYFELDLSNPSKKTR